VQLQIQKDAPIPEASPCSLECQVFKLQLLDMSILWKIAVFIEKPPATISNWYKTMNKVSF
jgi:hypothetical protein